MHAEHFWLSGMYWGLTALHLLDRLHEVRAEQAGGCSAAGVPYKQFATCTPILSAGRWGHRRDSSVISLHDVVIELMNIAGP